MDIVGILVAVLVVGGPALFTTDGFMVDFTNHEWLISVQAHALSSGGVPTYFLNAVYQNNAVGPWVFNPYFAFAGGTLYVVGGALALVLGGSVTAAYVVMILLAIAAAYGGMLWIARQLGARSWLAHVPAITIVTSAYYVTNLYGRGDWPEFTAVSMIPLLVAGAMRLLSGKSFSWRAATSLLVAAILFSGSHNITLLLGTIAMVATVAACAIAFRLRPSGIPWARVGVVAAVAALALGVNAWFLLPDLLHASNTVVGQGTGTWAGTAGFNAAGVIFNPLRVVPTDSSTPALYDQIPVWLLGWSLLVAALHGRAVLVWQRKAYLVIGAVGAAFLLPILVQPVFDGLPGSIRTIQFPYRLVSYVTLAVAGMVAINVASIERLYARSPNGVVRRLELGALLGVLAISIGLCVWQLWVPDTRTGSSYTERSQALASPHVFPRSWYAQADYADASARVVGGVHGALLLDPKLIEGNSTAVWVVPPPGTAPVATNIFAGGYLIDMHGLVRIGRTPTNVVVVRRPNGGSGPVHFTIDLAGGGITVGRVVTGLALVTLLALGGVMTARTLKRRVGGDLPPRRGG